MKTINRMIDEVTSELQKIHTDSAPMTDEYFRGMFNGMECLRACLTNTEPKYIPNKESGKNENNQQ